MPVTACGLLNGQAVDISAQLAGGIRALDLRLTYDSSSGVVYCASGWPTQDLASVLRQVQDFLGLTREEQGTEIIIIKVRTVDCIDCQIRRSPSIRSARPALWRMIQHLSIQSMHGR